MTFGIRDRQQFGLPRCKPFRARRALAFWTMAIAARVVGDAGEAAILATLDMTAKHRRAAGRDRPDHAPFDAPEMSGVRPFVTFAVAAEDVGQFERRPRRHPLSGRRHVQREPIEGTGGIADELRRDARIARRRRQVLVTERTRVIMHLKSTH